MALEGKGDDVEVVEADEVEETEGHQETTRKNSRKIMIMREGCNQVWIICPSMTQAERGL